MAAWHTDFNHHRPYSSLSDLTPAECASRPKKDQNTNRANLI
ncbi:hypothetical protein K3727_17165 [Rhodobacteraceae bacterium M382]|nr:hypothetical protein K3727_17165 [Rhodobacteraceae bacterium M382]